MILDQKELLDEIEAECHDNLRCDENAAPGYHGESHAYDLLSGCGITGCPPQNPNKTRDAGTSLSDDDDWEKADVPVAKCVVRNGQIDIILN